ncbi:MAG: DUF2889 domain-containing protein [bacterium]
MQRQHVHSRVIDYEARPLAGGDLALEAKLCDIRRVAFQGVLHDKVITPGIIHDVELDLRVDKERVLRDSSFKMYTVPFPDAVQHGGTCCQDILGAFDGLVGVRVDERMNRNVMALVGGPRGCFHGQTLAIGALPVINEALGGDQPRRVARHLLIDGYNYGATGVTLEASMIDSELPDDLSAGPMGEVIVEADLSISFEVTDFVYKMPVATLRCPAAGIDGEVPLADRLDGLRMAPGVFADLRRRLPGGRESELLTQLLSMMIPVTIQASIAQRARMGRPPGPDADNKGSLGQVDSCHMWAEGGALDLKVREALAERLATEK